jgi:hypothetical protein
MKIVIGLWQFGGDLDKMHRRLRVVDGDSVLVRLPEVIQCVTGKAKQPGPAVAVSDDALETTHSTG